MATARTTPASPRRALRLVWLLLFKPDAFVAEEEADNLALNALQPPQPVRALVLRNALFTSFWMMLGAAGIGYLVGAIGSRVLGCAWPGTLAWTQIIATGLLLWGTLFVRGWDVQTYGGVTLTERVNQWIYRTVFLVGNAMLVASLAAEACRP